MRGFTRLLLGVATAVLGVTGTAPAAETTIYTVTYVEVGPASAASGGAAIRQYGEASRRADGSLRVELLQRVDRPHHFAILAVWKDAQAVEAHRAGAAARELREKLQPLLASPNDERVHHALSVGPTPAPGALYVVTHVDVIPPRKDDGVVSLKQLAEESRKEAGNARFDVIQQVNRANHFTVIEVWKDRAAFDAHAMTAPTRQFREQLAPMSGSLYDERLYTALK